MKKVLSKKINFQNLLSNGDTKPVNAEQIHKLNDHLHALAQTDELLNDVRNEQAHILTDLDASQKQKISVVQLLEVSYLVASSFETRNEKLIVYLFQSWQQVFKETFQQYHQLFSSVAGEQDCVEALKLWTDYLHYIQQFLSSAIPDNYHNLSSDEQICQVWKRTTIYDQYYHVVRPIILYSCTKTSCCHKVPFCSMKRQKKSDLLSSSIRWCNSIKKRLPILSLDITK